jgi:hypothetical protein
VPRRGRQGISEARSTVRYNDFVITRGIREFMSRDWRAVRESKDAYWGERIARLGPLEGFRIAGELQRQAILADPSWPDAALRQEDLRHHARLAELFRRAAPTRRS